jgi:hypothetical protein
MGIRQNIRSPHKCPTVVFCLGFMGSAHFSRPAMGPKWGEFHGHAFEGFYDFSALSELFG